VTPEARVGDVLERWRNSSADPVRQGGAWPAYQDGGTIAVTGVPVSSSDDHLVQKRLPDQNMKGHIDVPVVVPVADTLEALRRARLSAATTPR
jgi:hypothetical protein